MNIKAYDIFFVTKMHENIISHLKNGEKDTPVQKQCLRITTIE